MKIYWTANQIPEFKNLSKKDRKTAWKYAHKKVFNFKRVFLLMIPLIILIATFQTLLGTTELSRTIISGILAGLYGLVYSTIITHKARPHLQEYINQNLDSN
jgi:uncharacterized membrane protein (DUF485 family)